MSSPGSRPLRPPLMKLMVRPACGPADVVLCFSNSARTSALSRDIQDYAVVCISARIRAGVKHAQPHSAAKPACAINLGMHCTYAIWLPGHSTRRRNVPNNVSHTLTVAAALHLQAAAQAACAEGSKRTPFHSKGLRGGALGRLHGNHARSRVPSPTECTCCGDSARFGRVHGRRE